MIDSVLSQSLEQAYKQRYGIYFVEDTEDGTKHLNGHGELEKYEYLQKGNSEIIRETYSDGTQYYRHNYDNGFSKEKIKTPGGKWRLETLNTRNSRITSPSYMSHPENLYEDAKREYSYMQSDLNNAKRQLKRDCVQGNPESKAKWSKIVSDLTQKIQKLEKLSVEERIRVMLHLTKKEENEMRNLIRSYTQALTKMFRL